MYLAVYIQFGRTILVVMCVVKLYFKIAFKITKMAVPIGSAVDAHIGLLILPTEVPGICRRKAN